MSGEKYSEILFIGNQKGKKREKGIQHVEQASDFK